MTTATRARGTLVDDARRAGLQRSLTGRFWLRWHVALMLAGAFCTGFLVNAALLYVPVHSIVARWLAALACGYGAWFVLMRVWLAYVGVRPFGPASSHAVDGGGIDVGSWSPGGRSGGGAQYAGGGGGSGGGGASGDIDAPAPSLARVSGPSPVRIEGTKGGFGVGDVLSGDDSGLFVVLAVIVLALVAALGGVVVYMVHEAPQLLVDVAFGSALASGLAGTTRRVSSSLEWCGSVWRATWKPFVVLAIVVVASAAVFAHVFPGARTLGEALLLWRP